MRPWLVVLVLGTAHADVGTDDGWRYTSRQVDIHPNMDRVPVAPAPPLPVFATSGALYMLELVDETPVCRSWTIRPGDRGRGTLVGSGELAYASSGDHLQVCGVEYANVRDNGAAVDVDGALWFRDAASCASARDKHRPVATDFGSCTSAPAPAHANTRARFERLLRDGGSLYAIVDGPRCAEVRVAPSWHPKNWTGALDGELRFVHHSVDVRGRSIRGATTWQYAYAIGGTTLGVTDGSTAWSDGTGFGTLCAHDEPIRFDRDSIEIGQRYYFTAAACRTGIVAARERASWFPTKTTAAPSSPDFGGC